MPDIYDQFDKATSNISACALIYGGKPAGRIVLKHGAAVTAFVQIWGIEMAKDQARGGGYDRATAAVGGAVAKLRAFKSSDLPPYVANALGALCSAFDGADGSRWAQRLERVGFTVATVAG